MQKKQLFPETKMKADSTHSPFSSDSNAMKFEQNVVAMMSIIQSKSLLAMAEENRGLLNPFCGKVGNAQQTHDLLNFRNVGQQEFLNRIAYFIIKQPSVHAPNRRRRLHTFSHRQKNFHNLKRTNILSLQPSRRKSSTHKKLGNQ